MVKKLLELLKGKKTYIVAIIMGIVTVLESLDYIGPDVRNQVLGVLGALGLSTLRAGVDKNRR